MEPRFAKRRKGFFSLFFILGLVSIPGILADEPVLRDPDRRVDVKGGVYASTHTSFPVVEVQGDRVFTVYLDRRYFASTDPFFHISVNQNGTWRGSDYRLNSNFPAGNLFSSMRQVLLKTLPTGAVYVLMIQDDSFRNGFFNSSTNQGETWLSASVSVGASGVEARKLGWRLSAVGPKVYAVWYDNRDNIATGNYNIYFTKSTNSGASWTASSTALNIRESSNISENIERANEAALCADQTRVYVVFKDKRNPNNNNDGLPVPGRIRVRYSVDNGINWLPSGTGAQEPRLDTGDTVGTESQNPDVACTGGTTLMGVWEDYRNGNWDLYFNLSTDGGATWRASDNRVDDGPAGNNATLPKILLGDGTPRKIYVIWQDDREGRTDLRFSVSADQGLTWSPSVALNVPPGGAWPHTPVSVAAWDAAADGPNLAVAWTDNRYLPENSNLKDVFAVTSGDGGTTFSAPARLDLGKPVASSESTEIDAAMTGSSFTAVYRDYRNDSTYSDIFGGGKGRTFDPNDADGDGRTGASDNCPNYPNLTQQDTDFDNQGDLCDSWPTDSENDLDGDGVLPTVDKCPDHNDFLQEDADGDGYGDKCDRCPSTVDEVLRDLDKDGTGDSCDANIDGDALDNTADTDDDNDGRLDTNDNCVSVPNARQLDDDVDSQGNDCDVDDQLVQGVLIKPASPPTQRMTWEKEKATSVTGYNVYFGLVHRLSTGAQAFCYRPQVTIPRAILTDVPPPGEAFYYLICTLNGSTQGGPGKGSSGAPVRQVPSSCSEAAAHDWDGDTITNNDDNCRFDANTDQADADNDRIGNLCDVCPLDPENDIDHDLICGNVDNCPTVFNPGQQDSDGDGMGDVCDTGCPDSDGDTICNDVDNCPTLFNPDQLDTDLDHTGNLCDPDDDNDGVTDAQDCAPLDPSAWILPGEISDLHVELQGADTQVIWNAPGAGTLTDLAGGDLISLVGDQGVMAATCLADNQPGAGWLDTRPQPGQGNGFYYFVRGQNACGGGSWGQASSGVERSPGNACP